MEDLKTLKGEVDSIIFKSEDTGFCVTLRRAKISL